MLKTRYDLRRLASKLLVVLADYYGIFTSITLFIWLLTGERIFLVNLYINTLPVTLMPSVFAVLLMLILRKWRRIVFNILPLLVLIIIYGEVIIPRQSPPEITESITVLTYNLSDGTHDFESFNSIVQQTNADIIALQEVSFASLNALETYQPEKYLHRNHTAFEAAQHGELVLSRWPILEATDSRPMRALIDTPYGNLAVYAVHIPFPLKTGFRWGTRRRTLIIDQLLSMVESETVPTLLIGDFNMGEATREYRRIHNPYIDVYRETNMGFGFTYPNFNNARGLPGYIPALLRIDFIFASPDIIPLESQVIYEGTSDHFPLRARVGLGGD